MKVTSNAQAFDGGMRENSETQQTDLGAKYVDSNGAVYRYVKVGGTATVAGKLYDGPAEIANHQNITVAAAAVANATSVTVTLGATAATANYYAGGKMVVNDEDGQGFSYTIKSHPAASLSTTLVLTLDADEPIITALTTSSQVTLVPNQYNGVIIHAASETGIPIGVATKVITTLYYGWIQTRGIASCLIDASPADVGQEVDASTTTDGSGTLGTVATASIGYALESGVSTEYNSIFLMMD